MVQFLQLITRKLIKQSRAAGTRVVSGVSLKITIAKEVTNTPDDNNDAPMGFEEEQEKYARNYN